MERNLILITLFISKSSKTVIKREALSQQLRLVQLL